MTPQEVETLFANLDGDLGDLSDIIVQVRALLPIMEPAVRLAVQGGIVNEATAAGQLLMHIGPMKSMLSEVIRAAKQMKV